MAVNTNKVGPGTLTIGADSAMTTFTGQVTACTLVPSVDNGDALYTLSGESVAGDRTESWTLEGTLLQDLGATKTDADGTTQVSDSKTEYLFENRGTTQSFVFTPSTASGKQIEGSLVVEATSIGGETNTKATSDFTFQLVGEPVITSIA